GEDGLRLAFDELHLAFDLLAVAISDPAELYPNDWEKETGPSGAGAGPPRPCSKDGGAPVAVLLHLAPDHVKVQLLELSGDGADAAVAHGAPVDLRDGTHLRAGADKEGLVRHVQLGAVHLPLHHREAQFVPGQLDDGGPGHALEDVGGDGRRDELAMAHQKEVLGGPLGDLAVPGQEDGLVAAVVRGFRPG